MDVVKSRHELFSSALDVKLLQQQREVAAEVLGRTEKKGRCEGQMWYRCSQEITEMLSVFKYKSDTQTYISLMLLLMKSLGSYTSDNLLGGCFKKMYFRKVVKKRSHFLLD